MDAHRQRPDARGPPLWITHTSNTLPPSSQLQLSNVFFPNTNRGTQVNDARWTTNNMRHCLLPIEHRTSRSRLPGPLPMNRLLSETRTSRGFMARGQVRKDPGGYRWTRALPPLISFSTSLKEAMDVSPGVVIASAPWAAP